MDARELTRDEKKKIRTLVTGMCANYDRESGLCLPLDCACYMLHKCWTGAYCRYFREAVLPLNPELQASLTTEGISPELRACAVCGKAFFARGASSLLFRRLQGRREPPKKPGTHEENAGEKAGRLLRFAASKGLTFRAFLRVFPGWEYLITFLPGLPSYFVTSSTSGHVSPRHRKEVSLGDSTRICDFESCHL